MVEKNRVIEFLELLKFDQHSRSSVSDKLSELKDAKLIPILFEIINGDEAKEVKIAAVRSLGYLEDPLTVKFLTNLFTKSNDEELIIEAIKAVSFFKSQVVVDTLNNLINNSTKNDIVKTASQAVQIIQGIAPEYSFDAV